MPSGRVYVNTGTGSLLMITKTRSLILFAVALLSASAAMIASPKSAAAEQCTITCEYCFIDRNTGTARCEQCTFKCTTALQ